MNAPGPTTEVLVEKNKTYHWYENNCETTCGRTVGIDDKLVLPPYRKSHLAMCPECLRLVLPTTVKGTYAGKNLKTVTGTVVETKQLGPGKDDASTT